jgi:uncharacterized 2Fe-2S/4Fe-4S cluster protein (DUF4445 family)
VNKKYKVKFFPFESTVSVSSGTSILDAARKANLPLKVTCGAKGTCGDCVIRVLSGTYQSKHSAALSEELIRQGYALACQTEVNDNLTIQLPQFQELSIKIVSGSEFFEEHKNNISGIYEINPVVKSISLRIAPPTLEDNYSDLKRLEREFRKKLAIEDLNCEYSVLRKLAHVVREEKGEITIVVFRSGQSWTIIDVKEAKAAKNIYGLACDIGTTTVVLYLVELTSGKILSTASSYNQQLKCGEDIISRINYAQKPDRLQELHNLIVMTVNNLIDKATRSAKISTADIYSASVSGNTTMIHLFLNLEPRYIREEPYVPTFNQVPIILSRDLGLKMNYEGKIYCGPAVGSYVGSDITAGLLCTPLVRDSKKISLFIDAGTNGELVVGNSDWLMTCACSAGPAFEGSGIKCGMPATEGAIEQLKIENNGELEYKAINGSKPKGLCGSGLVDLLAELFVHGYIDRHGKFNVQKAKARLVEDETGIGFLIEKGNNSYWGKDLIITEKDISNLIRTKGAMFSACSLLLKNAGLTFDKIDAFYIAGGFGQHLNIENSIRIGLLPDLERNKFYYIGNSSLLGAYLILLSDKNREMVNEISKKMTYIELNTEPSYMNEYTGALFLPHTKMELFPSVKQILNS